MVIIDNIIAAVFSLVGDAVNAVTNFVGAPANLGVVTDAIALQTARASIIAHEGKKDVVYKDSVGVLTGGIGHKITASDNLALGDKISQQTIDTWFNSDIHTAFAAARNQAAQTRYTSDLLAALIEVNYQLGSGWINKFPNTWDALKRGDATTAINNLQSSLWNQQTPLRVASFIGAIKTTYQV